MVTELRVYHSVPGKLPDVMKRFSEDTLRLFARHGIRHVGAWTTAIGNSNNDFTYMIEWASLAERRGQVERISFRPGVGRGIVLRTERNGPLLSSLPILSCNRSIFQAKESAEYRCNGPQGRKECRYLTEEFGVPAGDPLRIAARPFPVHLVEPIGGGPPGNRANEN